MELSRLRGLSADERRALLAKAREFEGIPRRVLEPSMDKCLSRHLLPSAFRKIIPALKGHRQFFTKWARDLSRFDLAPLPLVGESQTGLAAVASVTLFDVGYWNSSHALALFDRPVMVPTYGTWVDKACFKTFVCQESGKEFTSWFWMGLPPNGGHSCSDTPRIDQTRIQKETRDHLRTQLSRVRRSLQRVKLGSGKR